MIIYLFHRFLLLIITIFFLFLISFSISCFSLENQFVYTLISFFDFCSFSFNKLFHFNFEKLVVNGQVVSIQLKNRFIITVEICVLSFILSFLIGVTLGIISVFYRNKFVVIFIYIITLFYSSIPIFMFFLVLRLFFPLCFNLSFIFDKIYLVYNFKSIIVFLLTNTMLFDSHHNNKIIIDLLKYISLPVITIVLSSTSNIIRLIRNNTKEIINSNYVKLAKMRGLSHFAIIRIYIFYNSIIQIIPNLGVHFLITLNLTMITEFIYNLPGLGNWLIFAIKQKDYISISNGVLLIGFLIIVINLFFGFLELIVNPLKRKKSYVFR